MESELKIPAPALLIEKAGYTLKIYPENNLAEYLLKAETLLDEKMSRESKRDLENAFPGKKYFLLVGSEGFFMVTRKARKLAASKKFSNHLSAVGCYTTNSSLSLLAELYIKLNKPAVPTKLFYSREAAMEWLREQMNAEKPVVAPG
jgi:hypothetical protein